MYQTFRIVLTAFVLCSAVRAAPSDQEFFSDFEDISKPLGVAFSIGDAPGEAVFSGDAFAGVAGIPQLYFSGRSAWMVIAEGEGIIDFMRNASEVEFWARTQSSANGSTVITAFDDVNAVIDTVTLSAVDPFQLISFRGNIDRIEVKNNATGTRLNAIDDFGFTPFSLLGDFNGDGSLGVADLNLLSGEVRRGGGDLAFDLTDDGQVNQQDRRIWVEDVFGTLFGDADLNKEVAFADFLALSSNFGLVGGWTKGDFDGSGTVQFPAVLLLSSNFGKSATVTAAVPEPGAGLMLIVGLACFVDCARRKKVKKRRK